MAWELIESKGENWFEKGWSLDALLTPSQVGLGVAKDIYKTNKLEMDIGAYVVNNINQLFQGEIKPGLGIGMHFRF